MEDDLNFWAKWKTTSMFRKTEDDFNFSIFVNGRRLQFFEKWKTTSFFWKNGRQLKLFGKMEDNFNFLAI